MEGEEVLNMRCSEFRPPAIPLVTHDPYTSCWSMSDCLYDDWPRHWTGSPHSMYGVIRVDGKPMRFIGKDCRCEDTVRQTVVGGFFMRMLRDKAGRRKEKQS